MKSLLFCSFALVIPLLCIVYVESAVPGIGRDGLLNKLTSPLDKVINKVTDKTTGVLWFYNDDGELVKPTLEFPPLAEIEATTIDDKVFFTLYTPEKSEGEPLVINDVEKLKSTKFDPKRETVFVTHGWMNSAKSKACTLIRDAYLKKGGFNIIVVDWSKISFRPYGWASGHVKKVGEYVATMIDFLEAQGMDLNNLKLIGHSLGAHVMGSAGYHAKNIVNYLVGLDPALPLFYNSLPGTRISTHDAKNVEIIHTNALNLGIFVPVGHVDFYPNGGEHQVGCIADPGGACSHARSYELYAESINSDVGFYGRPCTSHLKMALGQCNGIPELMGGLKKELTVRGSYLLQTKSTLPFAMGQI